MQGKNSRGSGPSPLVPVLLILILCLLIGGPVAFGITAMLIRGEKVEPTAGNSPFLLILVIILLLAIRVLGALFPSHGALVNSSNQVRQLR